MSAKGTVLGMLRMIGVTKADAPRIEEYLSSFPADRERVTYVAERIPGLDHLEEFSTVSEWLAYTETMKGKLSWYMAVREEDPKIVGFCCLRHRLEYDDDDPPFASHLGCSVRPEERRKGYATEQLQLMKPIARSFGIDPLRIVCLDTNTGSNRAIRNGGGILIDAITGELSGLTVNRYDVPTSE